MKLSQELKKISDTQNKFEANLEKVLGKQFHELPFGKTLKENDLKEKLIKNSIRLGRFGRFNTKEDYLFSGSIYKIDNIAFVGGTYEQYLGYSRYVIFCNPQDDKKLLNILKTLSIA